MYKASILVHRREDMTEEEFIEYWEDDHGDMAHDIPGLVKYARTYPFDAEAAAYDGLAELYFESKSRMKESLSSDFGDELAADMENFAPDYEVILGEEFTIIDESE